MEMSDLMDIIILVLLIGGVIGLVVGGIIGVIL